MEFRSDSKIKVKLINVHVELVRDSKLVRLCSEDFNCAVTVPFRFNNRENSLEGCYEDYLRKIKEAYFSKSENIGFF